MQDSFTHSDSLSAPILRWVLSKNQWAIYPFGRTWTANGRILSAVTPLALICYLCRLDCYDCNAIKRRLLIHSINTHSCDQSDRYKQACHIYAGGNITCYIPILHHLCAEYRNHIGDSLIWVEMQMVPVIFSPLEAILDLWWWSIASQLAFCWLEKTKCHSVYILKNVASMRKNHLQ